MSHASFAKPLDNNTLAMLENQMLQVTLPTLFVIIFCISIPLNSVSLWFLCQYSRPWTPIIVFSINLTISDLLYSMLLPFQIIYHLKQNNWVFGDILCRLVTVLFYGNMHCSILTMTGISIERYLGIVHPLRYKVIRPIRTSLLTCIVIWILVLLPLIPLMQNKLNLQIRELQITTCFDVLPSDMFSSSAPHFIAYFSSLVFFFFLLPLFIMGFCYISIIQTLLRSSPTHLRETKKQTVYLIIVLLLLLIICYIPHIVTAVVHYILVFNEKSAYVEYKLAIAIQGFNCCFDPLVYYFGSKEFRRKVQKKLCRCVPVSFSENTPIFSEHDVQIMPVQKMPKK